MGESGRKPHEALGSHDGKGDSVPSRGRPLDRSRDAAIYQVTLGLLAECGYDRLTMELVASRARAGKGALYRRWSSKGELVAGAIASLHRDVSCPDTGSLRGDLEQLLASVESFGDDAFITTVIAGLATAACRDHELAVAFHEQFVRPRQGILLQVLERAATRGEIPPERDVALLAEIMPGLVLSRALATGNPPGHDFARRVIAEVLYPLAIARIPVPGIG